MCIFSSLFLELGNKILKKKKKIHLGGSQSSKKSEINSNVKNADIFGIITKKRNLKREL